MIDFLEQHKKSLEVIGFWDEISKTTILKSLEHNYKTEILRNYMITDIVLKDDKKFLIKWDKRFEPLTNEELKEQYERKDF